MTRTRSPPTWVHGDRIRCHHAAAGPDEYPRRGARPRLTCHVVTLRQASSAPAQVAGQRRRSAPSLCQVRAARPCRVIPVIRREAVAVTLPSAEHDNRALYARSPAIALAISGYWPGRMTSRRGNHRRAPAVCVTSKIPERSPARRPPLCPAGRGRDACGALHARPGRRFRPAHPPEEAGLRPRSDRLRSAGHAGLTRSLRQLGKRQATPVDSVVRGMKYLAPPVPMCEERAECDVKRCPAE